jgi:hypothetical protein
MRDSGRRADFVSDVTANPKGMAGGCVAPASATTITAKQLKWNAAAADSEWLKLATVKGATEGFLERHAVLANSCEIAKSGFAQ